jgi:hypothetical protein
MKNWNPGEPWWEGVQYSTHYDIKKTGPFSTKHRHSKFRTQSIAKSHKEKRYKHHWENFFHLAFSTGN